jgi:hypothetical protein
MLFLCHIHMGVGLGNSTPQLFFLFLEIVDQNSTNKNLLLFLDFFSVHKNFQKNVRIILLVE